MSKIPSTTWSHRRLRREARRAAQRQQSVLRAKKMRLARFAAMESPNSHATTKTRRALPRFFVGCSGWFYWHWRGDFYPSDLPTQKWFEHYARRFKTVELNAPFYSWPTVATVQSWIRQAGRRQFVYTVKVCELITHTKRFRGTKELVKDFGFIADLLGPKMGCFLFQLPPSFHYTKARLESIVSQLDRQRRNVVEFRHVSWWNEQVFSSFRKNGIIFCSCSGPKLPDELVKTSDDVYIRFHGTKKWYRHNYGKEELATWIERVKKAKPKRVWAYFNNDREGYALTNAKEFLGQLVKYI